MITPSTSFPPPSPNSFSEVVNGIRVYFSGGRPHASGGVLALIPSLGVGLSVVTSGSNLAILDTLTYSPRVVAITSGAAPPVPVSWRRLAFGGIDVSAPGSWAVEHESQLVSYLPDLTVGEAAGRANDASDFVVLDSGTGQTPCICSGNAPPSTGLVGTPTNGLIVDSGPDAPFQGDAFGRCMNINGLSVCPSATDVYGVLVLAVHVPGRSQPVAVEIGLAGSGEPARTILYSMRPSGSSPSPTTTTVKSNTTTTTPKQTLPPLSLEKLPVPVRLRLRGRSLRLVPRERSRR